MGWRLPPPTIFEKLSNINRVFIETWLATSPVGWAAKNGPSLVLRGYLG
jgi:hypothetical protein